MSCRFHPVAIEQQESIWFYTFKTWGEEQADRYLTGLHLFVEGLGREPGSAKRVPVEFSEPVYLVRYRHHYIYFKWSSSGPPGLLVLSILHESMDLPARLREALRRIEAGN